MYPTPSPYLTSQTNNDEEMENYPTSNSSTMSHLRPILVGYAFGPKKMSTMGVVMAEASMAVSTVVTDIALNRPSCTTITAANVTESTTTKHIASTLNDHDCGVTFRKKDRIDKRTRHEENSLSVCTTSLASEPRKRKRSMKASPVSYSPSYESSFEQNDHNDNKLSSLGLEEEAAEHLQSDVDDASLNDVITSHVDYETASIVSTECMGLSSNNAANTLSNTSGSIYFYTGRSSNGSLFNSNSNQEENGLKNIWSMVPSSTSPSMCNTSMSDSASITTAATSTLSAINGSTSSLVSNKRMRGPYHVPQHFQEMRVSFVPLDLDAPLEEQHGGKIDAILHKMTEDILCLSQLSSTAQRVTSPTDQSSQRDSKDLAIQRVERLIDYKRNHPSCCLLDHPNNVKAVMSRSDIANILSECLKGVATKTGLPVRTPSFHILHDEKLHSTSTGRSNDSTYQMKEFAKRIDDSPLTYPLIMKPLAAAGTVESHKMAVVLRRQGLNKVQRPCILQQYTNHNGMLYKVYVLGDRVWVFHRPSLPDLPLHECESASPEYVEFDSQRPYPSLSDFGFVDEVVKNEEDSSFPVTSEEIRPVADCLRKAFGLELFGFDILVSTCSDHGEKEVLVVDVNYFPSYKEVSNFSEILAQYLAQCAFEGRIKSLDSR